MLYRIADLAVDARSGHTRIVVEFWLWKADYEKGLPCVVVNDFYNNYKGDATVPFVNELGMIRYGGVYQVPYYEQDGEWIRRTGWDTQPVPLVLVIHEDILRWWHSVGKTKMGDKRDPGFAKAAVGVDPNAVLARQDVQALKAYVWTDEA